MTSHEISHLAQYFILLGDEANRPLTNKKLQKLLYYTQAWALVLWGEPIFEEPVEAWVHGPVIPIVYHKYKKFGFDRIKNESPQQCCTLLKNIKDLLDEVWRVYGKYDADYLETLSHSEDPWINARSALDEQITSSAIISHDSMKNYYSRYV